MSGTDLAGLSKNEAERLRCPALGSIIRHIDGSQPGSSLFILLALYLAVAALVKLRTEKQTGQAVAAGV